MCVASKLQSKTKSTTQNPLISAVGPFNVSSYFHSSLPLPHLTNAFRLLAFWLLGMVQSSSFYCGPVTMKQEPSRQLLQTLWSCVTSEGHSLSTTRNISPSRCLSILLFSPIFKLPLTVVCKNYAFFCHSLHNGVHGVPQYPENGRQFF